MRKFFRNSSLLILAILILVLLVGYFYLRTSLPQTSGTVRLTGLKGSVEIVRDSDGVPHIFAGSDLDAFFALGYVHAQDRMWQLEMNRRIGNGRLSEVLGDTTLDIDKFQRTMGYARIVRQGYEKIADSSKQALASYAAGVNAWIGEGHTLPPEFLILGFKPEPWTVYDSLVWAKMMAWDLGGDYDLELLRSQLAQALGTDRMAQLLPAYPKDGITILESDELGVRRLRRAQSSRDELTATANNQQTATPSRLTTAPAASLITARLSSPRSHHSSLITSNSSLQLLQLDSALQVDFGLRGRAVGSNDWVIGGSRTESGKPILADDPHLGSSIPSIWYLAEIQGDKIHAIGSTLLGLPAIVIGHNERIAWGVTNLNPDVQDLYIEHLNPANPNQYEVKGEWREIESYEEVIRVKGQEQPIPWAARWTRHGPLISDVADTPTAMSLRWTALDADDTTIDAFLNINYAANWDQFRDAMRAFVGPSQNFVYGDVDGNIGYIGPGHIPLRAKGNGFLPAPGWTDDYEWMGWIPFEQLPQAYNPEIGYLATANNRVADASYPYFISNDWAEPYRAKRIVELIEQMSSNGEKISPENVAAIQADQSSTQVHQLLPALLALKHTGIRQQRAIEVLQQWDGKASLDSTAASIYEAWVIELTRALFEDDLRGDLYKEMANRTDLSFVGNVLHDPALGAVWCDNQLTTPKESCEDTALSALDKALDAIEEQLGKDMSQWQWQKLHITQYPHRPFSQVPVLRWFYHRSIPNGGNRYTVNVAPVRWSEPYNQYHVPSYRQIVDLADLNNSRFIQTTGQSGNPLSKHYDDFIERHRNVQYLPMRFGQTNVSGDILKLEPK